MKKIRENESPVFESLGSEVIKLFSCPTQLNMKFFLLLNVKMPTVVGILTFTSMKKIFFLINVKMPTIVGILTFMSMKNSILGLSEPGKYLIS